MNGIIAQLKDLHTDCIPSCITTRCRKTESKCTLLLTAQGEIVCFDCDKCTAFVNQKMPDFLIACLRSQSGPLIWLVVEMKRNVNDVTSIIEQLQAGADAVANHSIFQINTPCLKPLPLVLHSGKVRSADIQTLHRKGVRYKGRRIPVVVKRCDAELEKLLEQLLPLPNQST